jgi:hypothetical protein
MTKLQMWLLSRIFKIRALEKTQPKLTPFQQYCNDNPWAAECRIYDV